MIEPPVIIVKIADLDGTVVCWHHSLAGAEHNKPAMIASRHGVRLGPYEYLTDIPDSWVEAAKAAHARLQADPGADMSDLATHEHTVTSNGPIRPIEREG